MAYRINVYTLDELQGSALLQNVSSEMKRCIKFEQKYAVIQEDPLKKFMGIEHPSKGK